MYGPEEFRAAAHQWFAEHRLERCRVLDASQMSLTINGEVIDMALGASYFVEDYDREGRLVQRRKVCPLSVDQVVALGDLIGGKQ